MNSSAGDLESSSPGKQTPPYASGKPAVGVVATEETETAVVRALLRAVQRDYHVLLTYHGESVPETFDFSGMENVRLIDPPVAAETTEHRRMLMTVAHTLSLPGLVFHGENHGKIDYEATRRAFDESEAYCITPVLQSETSEQSAGTFVAIPAHNEATTIASVVTDARKHASEVFVIDDGSTDDTVARAEEAGAVVVERETNGGYGAALKTAFQTAEKRRADQLVILDGDGQHDSSDIPRLVDALRNDGADIVIGSRFAAESGTHIPVYRRFGLAVVNLLSNLSLGVVRSESWIGDTQSGYRAYNRRAIRSLAADEEIGDRMSASTDILYHAHHNDYAIAEVGTTIDYDVKDGSHHNPVSHGIHLVMNIIRTVERDRPITFLGIPGFLSAFIGLGFGYWTIVNYVSTGGFPTGIAITSMFFVLAGVFACFTAIILHALSTQLEN